MLELISEQPIKKTRKSHRCHGCLEIIPIGSPALASTNVDDRIYTLYFCQSCADWLKTECAECRECFKDYNNGMFEGDIETCRRERAKEEKRNLCV